MSLLILYSLIVVPLQVGLNIRYDLIGRGFDYFIDVLFAIDMGLTFLTAYEKDGKMIRNFPDIAKNYLRSWFLPDALSTFPFGVVIVGASDSTLRTFKLARALRLFRLFKLLRILRLNRKLGETKAADSVHPVVIRIAALFTYIFFVAHLLACAYYFVADCENYPDDQTAWRDCGHRQSSSSHYLASLYFVLTAIFGVGYGDIVITTTRGRLFSIFVMFVGSITFGFIVATVSECVETWNPKITARKRKMDEMLAYCNERELKIPLKIAILRHFDYFYHKSSLFSEQSILQSMPILLHQSLLEHSRQSCLNHLNLFQKEEHSTLTNVLPHLQPAFVDPREMIVKEHDYLVDMIFIMKGTIHATMQNEKTQDRLVLAGIFGPGSDFGASNALSCNSLSWANYRATVLTDVMWLRYEVIQDSTGRMKELFKNRAEEEEKNQEEVLKGIHKSEEVGNLRVPSFILCDGQVISCRHAIRMLGGGDELNDASPTATAKVYKTVYMRGYGADGLPNFVEDQETSIQMRLRYVINPYANYKLKFDMLVAIFALFSTVTIPLRLGLKLPPHLAWNIVDLITEILFFVDMIASFFTAYEQSDYSLNTIHSHIARRYLKSWFLIDLLSSVPFYRLSKAAKSLQALVLGKTLRIIRIFRLASAGKLFRFVNTRDTVAFNSEMIALRDGLNRIFYSIGFVALFTHLCACFWSWLALPSTGRNWASEIDIHKGQYLTTYIAATYWSYTTLSTVGYGDIVSENDSERMYTILIFVTGSSLLAYVVGLVRAYAFNRNGSQSAQEEKLNLVRHYLAEQGISKSLKEVIIRHFTYYMEQSTPYNQREIWSNLPHHLRQQAILQSYDKISHRFTSFFSHFKSSVFAMLLKFMEPARVSRGSYIYTFETGCDGMYFILEGIVEIIDEDDATGKEVIVAQIRKGMFFGHEKILGLTTDFLGVRALTPLRMLHLRTRHLEHLRRYLPLVYSTLSQAITQSLQPPEQRPSPTGARAGRARGGIFGAEDQQKLAELLSDPAKMKASMLQRRGYSRQQSSIEEVIEWFVEDMDETLPTERGVLLMGEVCNPHDPTKILSLNSQDRYRAMKDYLKETSLVSVQRIDENDSEEQEESEDKKEGEAKERKEEKNKGELRREDSQKTNKLMSLLKSGKKHYHKLQINFHPRRAAVERKYRVRSLHDSSLNDAKGSQDGVDSHPSNDILPTESKLDHSPLGMSTPIGLGVAPPAVLREENSYHFDPSSDSDSD